MVVTLMEMPSKIVMMDVVIADIPPNFDVLLSRSWTSKLKGTLHMEISYSSIPMDGGNKIIYSEKRSPYVVSSQDKPDDHAIYIVSTDLGSSIFFNDVSHSDLKVLTPIEKEGEVVRR